MFKQTIILSALIVITTFFIISSCVHSPQVAVIPADGEYPKEVGAILINKCAVSGCHNQASYVYAGGLLLDSWSHLLNGSASGAAIVAYSPQFSPLLYHTNTDSSLGIIDLPAMPYSTPGKPMPPLSKTEYQTLYNWIAKGAPDKNGNIPFASDPTTRQKIYLTQSGCDLVAVIDAQTRVVMRYIPVGLNPGQIENMHDIEVSSDGMYAYIVFLAGNYIQKIDTRTDTVVASLNLGTINSFSYGWSILLISPTGNDLVTSDFLSSSPGFVTPVITAGNMQIGSWNAGPSFTYPHGIGACPSFDTFFVTCQFGNIVYKFSTNIVPGKNPLFKQIPIEGAAFITDSNKSVDPHQIQMSPDNSKYFVTCQRSNEVRVMDAYTDQLLDSISVGIKPQEMALSESHHYLFVACEEDSNAIGRKGSIYVLDYTQTPLKIVKVLYGNFYQPHDITVDEKDGLIFIPSLNANPNGPAPHHATSCGGRAGWYSVYNLNTLEPADNKQYNVLVYPYAIATRF